MSVCEIHLCIYIYKYIRKWKKEEEKFRLMREDGSNQIFTRRLQREWLRKIGSGDERREYRRLDVPGGFLRIIFYGLLGQDRLL